MSRRYAATAVAWVVAAIAFAYFAYYRVRFVGGCDSAAYVAEALRLRGVDAGLAPDASLPYPAAFVPICMVAHGGVVRSIFPPGFPMLLSAPTMLGMEFYVTPFFGALGGLLLFLLARPRAGVAIALGLMIAWYAAPMTFWGSTQVMSDYVAAALVLGAILAAERGRALIAGLVLGLALGVRPTCVLALPSIALSIAPRSSRSQLSFAVGLIAAGVGWILFVGVAFRSFDMAYAGNVNEMHGEHFVAQLTFLSCETARQYAPVLALAIIGVARAPRSTAIYVLWFGLFLVVHSLWRNPYDGWWHLRFLAPALPALFLAASLGARSLFDSAGKSVRNWMGPAVATTGGAALATYVAWSFAFPHAAFLRQHQFDAQYRRDVDRVVNLVPPDAVIGTREHSIVLRLYGHLQSFQWCHDAAPALVRAALASRRSVYVIFMFDDENGCPAESRELRRQLEAEDIAILPSGSRLIRLFGRTSPRD